MNKHDDIIKSWLQFTNFHTKIQRKLDHVLQKQYQIALKEFYVLLFLSEAPDQKLRLSQLQQMVGLSQSAMSRLAARMEQKSCGVIRRSGYDDDKRGVCAVLTDRGEVRINEIMNTVNQTLRECFSQEEIDHLLLLMNPNQE
ncbi:MarR family winged helix-turn-helix transcriptional regulator [Desmospora activa]|uniref:DNA-binding MarR family transcriptional regulator n=1 Tax=Desmospora activa DSM 45169 TaxID=1121389 RepID=A0A2T4Z7D2_9BACL|nr:MarR family transcriptional regulator [Desmospora activa]PTM57794.1 DNA-binding MarR family transcriptional regulator [Desmospora activa DSM 45169]